MDEIWKELIRAVPWGAVIIILRWLDIKEKVEERKDRENNAKDKAQQDRDSQQMIASSYANAINSLAKSVQDQTMRDENSTRELKETLLEQYKNMGITKDLLDFARIRLQEQETKKR